MKLKGSSLVIVLLLVLFPFVSWLYLKNGISFRKKALDELAEKTTFDYNQLGGIDTSLINRKIMLIDLKGEEKNTANIYSQFKESTDFVIVSTSDRYPLQLNDSLSQIIKANYPNKDYVLVDNDGKQRSTYTSSEEDLKKAVIHIATLIPFVEKKKPRGIK